MAPNPTFEILASPAPCPVGNSGHLGSPPLDNVKTCLVNSSNVTTWQAISMQPTQNHSSPDYFNTCVTGQCSTGVVATWAHAPYTYMGYQQPLSGNGFIGIFSIYRSYADGTNGPAYQLDMGEYFYSKLLTPMLKGNTYKVKFFISLARSSDAYVKKNFGAYFTKGVLTPIGTQTALAFQPQIHTGMVLGETYDAYTWKPVSGQFIASDNFEYITIGHFKTLPVGVAPFGIDFGVKTRENVCVNHPAPTDDKPTGNPDGYTDDLPIYYYVDTDGLTPMVQECSCNTDLDITLVPISGDDGDDCCYEIKLENNGDCVQEIVGLRVKDLGYRYAFAGSGELKVVPQIMQPGDNVGFFVNETYSNSVQNGLQLLPNGEKILGTICLTPDNPVNGTFGKFILLRNENIGGVYQVKCEKEKEFAPCNHSNNCCNQVLKSLKVTSVPTQDGGECCNKIEGELVQTSNNCGFTVKIERESNTNIWQTMTTPNITINAQGKFSFNDCSNFKKSRYRISLVPTNGSTPCVFIRNAACKTSCCIQLGAIDVQEKTLENQSGCCFEIKFNIEQGSCLESVEIIPDNGAIPTSKWLTQGLNVLTECIDLGTTNVKLVFNDITGEPACERTFDLVCTNCCSKVPDMSGATVVPGPTNSEACCYIVNGTIPNNNGCISKITYNHYNSETDLNEPAEVTVSGNSYSIPICVQSTVNNPNNVSFAFEGANGVSCIRELNLPCTPDCCSRIGNITELYGGNNDCCRTFTGTILFHEQDPCFTSFTYSTYSNGIWIQQNGSIAPNGQFTLSFCVPRTNINYPVQIKFTGEDELECTITLNGQCSGDVGPGEGGN